MKTKVYLGIAARIILLFATATAVSFITPHMRAFFGDRYLGGYDQQGNELWEWGERHYWYSCCAWLLFILSVMNVIMAINNIIKNNYNFNLITKKNEITNLKQVPGAHDQQSQLHKS